MPCVARAALAAALRDHGADARTARSWTAGEGCLRSTPPSTAPDTPPNRVRACAFSVSRRLPLPSLPPWSAHPSSTSPPKGECTERGNRGTDGCLASRGWLQQRHLRACSCGSSCQVPDRANTPFRETGIARSWRLFSEPAKGRAAAPCAPRATPAGATVATVR